MYSELRKKVAQVQLRYLLGIWILALGARVTIFSSGGIGAWVCVTLLWVATASLLAVSVQRVRTPTEYDRVRYVLVIAGLLAFCYGVFGPSGLAKELTTAVWLLCVVGLLISYVRGAIHRGSTATR